MSDRIAIRPEMMACAASYPPLTSLQSAPAALPTAPAD